MEHRKLNAPVKLSVPLGRNLGSSGGAPLGCVSVFLGVFGALAALLFLAWGVCFMAHIGHEQTLIQNVAAKVKDIKKTPPDGLTDTEIEGQIQEITQLVSLDAAAKKSMYDPFWFLDDAP
jgi:hypothetical protein